MPTYTISAPVGRLSDEQRAALAREVTRAHRHHTGAQTFFAQVMFVDVPPSQWFIGGAPIEAGQIFIHGQVRAGRPAQVKRALLEDLTAIVSRESGFPRYKVWGYIHELPPSNMVEFGHVLPEPGHEVQWLESLPGADRDFLLSIGR
jgi:phenylpyruvate tautomerase PptA (4-oxalocrotonate tautomerase family)